MRILVGFSGGVDSAMAALLLRERGHDVVAAMMSVRDASGHGCGSAGDADAARRLAARLDIPFHVFDCSAAYRRSVLDRFRDEYLAGRTPNPCVLCNPSVKFSVLPAMAEEAGVAFDRFATGHYARIGVHDGRPALFRGTDPSKDQSYFLYRLTVDQLARTVFPLGDLHKDEVRRMAAERGVPVSDKPDSQDFYDGEYTELLGVEEAEGDVVDMDGAVLGRHKGYWRYTPGQRKGLGVAHTEPLYVVRLEPAANRVVVGTREQQLRNGCVADNLVFVGMAPGRGDRVTGRVRSAQPLKDMIVELREDGTLRVRFAEPLHGIAPGQSLVLYAGDRLLGGGFITDSF